MADDLGIWKWRRETMDPRARADHERDIRLKIRDASLRDAALLFPGTKDEPLKGIQRFLYKQINNEFMTEIFPSQVDWMNQGAIQVTLTEKTRPYPVELTLKVLTRKNLTEDAGKLARAAMGSDVGLRGIASLSSTAEGFKIDAANVEGMVRGYNALMGALIANFSIKPPLDIIALDPAQFKAADKEATIGRG